MEKESVKQHGPWRIRQQKTVYRDPWISVRRDEVVRPDGADGTYCVVDLKPGVSVLALDSDGFVYLTEEFHYAVGRVTLEVVSGGRESQEDPQIAACRELKEELGISAERWTDLGVVDPFTGSVASPAQLFLAEGLTFGETSPEGTELIRCVKLPLDEAVERVMDGRISHGPSGLVILKTARLLAARGGGH